MEYWALAMFLVLFLLLLIGYPVAFTLGAIALGFGTVFLDICRAPAEWQDFLRMIRKFFKMF